MSDIPIKSLSGTADRLPWQWRLWRRLHAAARRQFGLYGYGELSTPVIEEADLFVKGTGEDTEIVEKQMYTIPPADTGADRDGETVTLRPEGTPPAIRAYLEANLHKKQQFQKFWYAGPMFRRERPQKGRLRQFHQIGVEAVGGASPLLDAETILLADSIYKNAGLSQCRICINTIGCPECRPIYHENLRNELEKRKEELCPDCSARLRRNVLRVLDCKNTSCRKAAAGTPCIRDMVCEKCLGHYEALKSALDAEGLGYEEEPHLVRGLDYYTRTVYEIKHDALGARDTICGGGRYDGLVPQMGGPQTPCVGFAMGVEPSLIAMEEEIDTDGDGTDGLEAYVVCFEDSARSRCFQLLMSLRKAGVAAEMDFENRSPRAQMKMANKTGAEFCLLVGERELTKNEVTLKNMKSGQQWNVPWEDTAAGIREAGS